MTFDEHLRSYQAREEQIARSKAAAAPFPDSRVITHADRAPAADVPDPFEPPTWLDGVRQRNDHLYLLTQRRS